MFIKTSTADRSQFFLTLAVLAGLVAIDAVWWQGQQLSADFDTFTSTAAIAVPASDEHYLKVVDKAIDEAATTEIDAQLSDVDASIETLK